MADGGFYAIDPLPSTAARMALYAEAAPALALAAIAEARARSAGSPISSWRAAPASSRPASTRSSPHALGLDGSVERTLIGFMGCYAAVAALRTAHHIVRSEPEARVLVVTVELSTLHLQPDDALEPLLAMLQFGDGAAAAIVSAEPHGLALSSARSPRPCPIRPS